MDPIRIGIVGSGGMANRRAENFQRLDTVELAAVAARNPETGPALAEKFSLDLLSDWRELIERKDVDAVVVCTHNEIHGPIIADALRAGKHVFTEYPVARHARETEELDVLINTSGAVLRVAHSETVSAAHRALKEKTADLGNLLCACFLRLTPGRGVRPEVLFNLNLSGPPALFFVYHVYPLVSLFGPAAWVESGAVYEGLEPDGGYRRFANTLTVGFQNGGLAQWSWAGGVEIKEAEETQRIVLSGATLSRSNGSWELSTSSGAQPLDLSGENEHSLETLFLHDISKNDGAWRSNARLALHAARIGQAAEESAEQNRRVILSETN